MTRWSVSIQSSLTPLYGTLLRLYVYRGHPGLSALKHVVCLQLSRSAVYYRPTSDYPLDLDLMAGMDRHAEEHGGRTSDRSTASVDAKSLTIEG